MTVFGVLEGHRVIPVIDDAGAAVAASDGIRKAASGAAAPVAS